MKSLLICLPVFVVTTLAVVSPANASLLITTQSVIAAPGSMSNFLDVFLTNSGPAAASIAGFSFGVSAATPNINFTSADFATSSPYIFAASSFDQDFGFTLNTSSGQSLMASDSYDSMGGVTVAAGATYGLGRLLFDVAANTAPGPISVTLSPYPDTSLSDPSGGNVPYTGVDGVITVAPAVVTPEPAAFVLLATGLGVFGILRRRR